MTQPIEIPVRFNIAEWFLDRPAEAHPERIAILCEPAQVCYGELRELANRVGNALRGSGSGPGDRVLIVLRDSAEFIAAFFGATKIGAIAVPVNSFARAGDYAHYLTDADPFIAIVDQSALAEFLPAVADKKLKIISVGGATAQAVDANWPDWLGPASAVLSPHPTSAHDPAFLLYTSGSGGLPKAAVHQHKDMLLATRSYAESVLGICADDRTFSVSKLFFAYGLGNGMYFPLSAGASTMLNPERTRVDRVVELVAKHRADDFLRRTDLLCCAFAGNESRPHCRFLVSAPRGIAASRCLPNCSTSFASASGSRFWMASDRLRCCIFLFRAEKEMLGPGVVAHLYSTMKSALPMMMGSSRPLERSATFG